MNHKARNSKKKYIYKIKKQMKCELFQVFKLVLAESHKHIKIPEIILHYSRNWEIDWLTPFVLFLCFICGQNKLRNCWAIWKFQKKAKLLKLVNNFLPQVLLD